MKLALNYSPQAADLITDGAIEIDLFKCPAWPALVATAREIRPIYVHFDLHAGTGMLTSTDWYRVDEFLAATSTSYVNLHLSARSDRFPDIPVDSTEPSQVARVAESLVGDVSAAATRFGRDRVIVENIPYRGDQGYSLRPCIDPQVIHEVVDATGCGFLLDIAHAKIVSQQLGIDTRTYLQQLPVRQLRELHATGVRHDGQRLRDHMPMTEDDWDLLGWVMERIRDGDWCRPWALTLEYGGVGPLFDWRSEPRVLAEEVPKISLMLEKSKTQQ